jgi:hypothetical protein
MPQQIESDDVVVVGWLRGDDYEAALAYQRPQEPREHAESDSTNPASAEKN